jgi:uncharacterized protein involved in exopolysaccharide biosynthesis/Mrp family chromosome partitioning ATPase
MFFRRKKSNPPAPAPVVAVVGDGEPDLGGLGRAIWAKRTRIIATTLIVTAAAFVVVNALTPRYRSEARILLEAKENVFLRAEADRQNGERAALDPEAVASQVQLVLSRDLAREVIKKENLSQNPEFDSAVGGMSIGRALLGMFGLGRDPSSMSLEERTLEAFYDHMSVSMVEKSRVIAVSFSSANPDLAARVANRIAETYLTLQMSAKQEQTRAAGNWLSGEIAKMRVKVADAEQKIEEYRAKANLFAGANNASLPSQQLSEISSQISAARGQKADLEARAQQLRESLRTGKSIESSDIGNSESMRRLSEQRVALRAQLAEQSSTLLDQHPRIKELRAQIAELDRQIRIEGDRLVQQLENDAKVAGNRLQTLTASLDTVKKLASKSNEQDLQLRALERESKAQRDLLESYLAKYREATARENIDAAPPEGRIISRATPALKPDFPKKLPVVLIAAFAGFALSAGFVVTGELLSPTSYTYAYPAPVYAQAPVVAAPVAMPVRVTPTGPTPPPMPVMPVTPVMATAAPSAAPFAPPLAGTSIEQMAARLRQSGEAGKRVAVVGSQRNVGATYSAISLARALGGEANVVLVDFAFRAPNLSVISTDPNAPGVAELVRGAASFADVITRDQFSQVHLIATGQVGDPAALAASPELATMLEALARSYDHVVVDLGAVPDAPLDRFAPLAQNVALVVGDAAGVAARSARDRLAAAGFGEVGLLVSGVRAAAA